MAEAWPYYYMHGLSNYAWEEGLSFEESLDRRTFSFQILSFYPS